MAIISTAEYKTYAGISDTDWDTLLDVLIPMVQAQLERYCGRVFDEATYTDQKHSGNGEGSIWLANAPITAMTAVKTVATDGTTDTLDSGDYRFTEDGELIRLQSGGAWDYQSTMHPYGSNPRVVWSDDASDNLLISYTGGYSAGTMPADLKGLMYTLVDGAMDERGENFNLSASGNGVETRTNLAPDLITRRYADLCRPWRGSGLVV